MLSAIAYVVFLGYLVVKYDPSETGTFLLLAASATLFVGLGYVLRERSLTLSRRRAGAIVAALLLISVALIGADVLGGGVTYTTALNDSATVAPRDDGPANREFAMTRTGIGTVTVRNEFVFTRPVDLPSLSGCVVGTDAVPDRIIGVQYERSFTDRPDVITGRAEDTFGIVAEMPIAANVTAPTTFAIERGTDCDVARSDPTIVVAVGDDGPRPD